MQSLRSHAWLLATGFWTLFGVICGMQIWLSMITHGHSLTRVIVYQVVVWELWLLFSFAIGRLARRWPLVPPRARNVLIHLLVGCVFSTLHAAWWVAFILLIRPYDVMNPTEFTRPFQSITGSRQAPVRSAGEEDDRVQVGRARGRGARAARRAPPWLPPRRRSASGRAGSGPR